MKTKKMVGNDTREAIRASVKEGEVAFISLQFSDLLGQPKIVTVSANKLNDILDSGIWFDGSSIEGFARIAESDMLLKPDLNTFAILPWSNPERKAARLICNAYRPDGTPLPADPRRILMNVLNEAKGQNLTYEVGAEFEFYLMERNKVPALVPHDDKGYFDYTPQSRATEICEQTMQSLSAFGIESEMHHHEVGNGQHEIDTRYSGALKAADNILTLKLALKAHTSGSDLKAVWMPKPLTGFPGNGLHVHQSLWREGKNTFYNAKHLAGLSSMALHFLAGQLTHAKAISALVSPTVNSYKRLVPGFEAPVYVCWGQINRSALIRVPQSSKDKAAQAARLEYRAPDPSINPYLAFAALLAAGLDGIKKKRMPPDAVEEDVYHMETNRRNKHNIATLPTDLREALDELEEDTVILNIFGIDGAVGRRYLEIKRKEWLDFSTQVTPWEVDRYL